MASSAMPLPASTCPTPTACSGPPEGATFLGAHGGSQLPRAQRPAPPTQHSASRLPWSGRPAAGSRSWRSSASLPGSWRSSGWPASRSLGERAGHQQWQRPRPRARVSAQCERRKRSESYRATRQAAAGGDSWARPDRSLFIWFSPRATLPPGDTGHVWALCGCQSGAPGIERVGAQPTQHPGRPTESDPGPV